MHSPSFAQDVCNDNKYIKSFKDWEAVKWKSVSTPGQEKVTPVPIAEYRRKELAGLKAGSCQ